MVNAFTSTYLMIFFFESYIHIRHHHHNCFRGKFQNSWEITKPSHSEYQYRHKYKLKRFSQSVAKVSEKNRKVLHGDQIGLVKKARMKTGVPNAKVVGGFAFCYLPSQI